MLNSEGERSSFTDHTLCMACKANSDLIFWNEERYNGIRSEVVWEKMEENNEVKWKGDRRPPYNPGFVLSPFPPVDEDKGKIHYYDMWESGCGFSHSCKFGRIPHNVEFQPFLPAGTKWPKGGEEGYIANIKITLVGCVEQDTPGKWKWVSRQKFDFELPWSLRKILGKTLKIDTWVEVRGEKAIRGKKKKIRWMESEHGRMQKAAPKGTTLTVTWEETLLPWPGRGMIVWGVYAQLTRLQGLGLTKQF